MVNKIHRDDYMYSIYKSVWDTNESYRILFENDFKVFLFVVANIKRIKKMMVYV